MDARQTRIVLAAALTLAVGAAVSVEGQKPSKAPAPESPIIASSSELVVLPVVVTDRRDRFVDDLSRDHFTVFDNGRPQDIALFTAEDTPVSVAIVIDTSGSMRPKLGEVIAATLAFARLSNPEDELFTITFSDSVHDLSRSGPLLAENQKALEAELTSIAADGQTALYDGLAAALGRLEAGTRSRKALILLSDGGDNASHTSEQQILERARRSSVTIYTIGLFEPRDRDSNPGLLKSLARATGGERYLPSSAGPLIQVCSRIARELRAGYTLGFVPPDRDGAFHRVRVETTGAPVGKVNVRTRRGYFAAAPPPS